ncbi:malic oxidoreductase [Artemisia annua]|uniref:Malic oxidoreductase n=1 Tax=Artemisia annua TaxID=35608 RepID=A0A2U1LIN6_ARTAN|nr:malic oxidoreductase [Artemisia annua]
MAKRVCFVDSSLDPVKMFTMIELFMVSLRCYLLATFRVNFLKQFSSLHCFTCDCSRISLASCMTNAEIQKGKFYPSIGSIGSITAKVVVLRSTFTEQVAKGKGEVGPKELANMSRDETIEYVMSNMWYPVYSPLVHEK